METKKYIEKISLYINNEIDSLTDYFLNQNSLLEYQSLIKEYLNRKSKKIRPILLVLGYLGYSSGKNDDIYKAAAAIEIIHNFILIHDDIIDEDDIRRNKPSMHKLLEKKYSNNVKTGEKLAIICGDILYSLGVKAFINIDFKNDLKFKALDKIFETALFTGFGEHIEFVKSTQDIEGIGLEQIYKIYDMKTSYYTFSLPLNIGMILGQAQEIEQKLINSFGQNLGRAFQIKNDMKDLFSGDDIDKEGYFNDLDKSKKTAILWHCYNNSADNDRKKIRDILSRNKVSLDDYKFIRELIKSVGSLDFANAEMKSFISNAINDLEKMEIKTEIKKVLYFLIEAIFNES